MLFFTDKQGKEVQLNSEAIKHISKHISLKENLHLIENVMKNPEIITVDEEREDIQYIQKFLKNEDLYLIIVIKIKQTFDSIITIYKSKKPKV